MNFSHYFKPYFPEERLIYHEKLSQDESGIQGNKESVAIVVRDEEEIKKILEIATLHHLTLIVRGAGSGKSGGVVPVVPSVILDISKMNAILEIDEDNQIAVVQPGVITKYLKDALEEKGWFYPPDPASMAYSTIGGNVAENAGGPSAIKYGVTGRYVFGIEGFLIDGTPFKFGGKCHKDVAGYDLLRCVIGSEGTLVIMTKIYLNFIPKPESTVLIEAAIPSFQEAIQTLTQIRRLKIQPSAAEFIDKRCLDAVSILKQQEKLSSSHQAFLLIELDGSVVSLEQEKQTLTSYLNKHQYAYQVYEKQEDQKNQWQKRQSISEALKYISQKKKSHDVSVPPSKVAQYMSFLDDMNQKSHLQILGYGHLGDGNIHVNILQLPTVPVAEEEWRLIEDELFKTAVQLGGSISGEHGIGLSKKEALTYMFSQTELHLFKQLKQMFDPQRRLNPNKIIDLK